MYTRYSRAGQWKQASQELIQYYFDTTDMQEIIAEHFGSKRTIKKMNMHFKIVYPV